MTGSQAPSHGALSCRVDSFYSTLNVHDRAIIEAPPEKAAATAHPRFASEEGALGRLVELRERYHLDRVAADSEIESLARLCTWVKSRWEHKTPDVFPPWDAVEMLERADRGEKYYCVQSAILMLQCCQALGWRARKLEIHAADGNNHSVIEVWLEESSRWAVMDPDYNLHYSRADAPLSALDLHDAWVGGFLDDVQMVRGPCPYTFGKDKGCELYQHLYYLWRNDFLSRPLAPVRLVHFTDEAAPAQLIADGMLLSVSPTLFGPHSPYRDGRPDRMRPFSLETSVPLKQDGVGAWMADANGEAHFIEVHFEEPRGLREAVVKWPRIEGAARAPGNFRISTLEGGVWRALLTGDLTGEEAEYPLSLPMPPGRFEGFRIDCPPDSAELDNEPRFGVAQLQFEFD